jgi:hypothetical protein
MAVAKYCRTEAPTPSRSRFGNTWENYAAAFTQANPAKSWSFAIAAQDHFIAILKELANVAVRKLERLGAARGDFEQAAAISPLGAGYSATADEIARAHGTAVRAMMSDHLR